MKRLVDNLPELFGGSGSIIGLITLGKVLEVLVFAALGAIVGLVIKEIWNCAKKLLSNGNKEQ